MPNLAEPPAPKEPVAHRGIVVDPPAALGDPFTVRLPDFDALHVFEIRRWERRESRLPVADDECLVIVDDEAEPWVAAWWPLSGDGLATEGLGMIIHGSDPNIPRGVGYAHYIWVGTVSPEDAAAFDLLVKIESGIYIFLNGAWELVA